MARPSTLAHSAVLTALLGLLGHGAAPVSAGTLVYRCGPEGRLYQQAPCAGGQAFEAGDDRTPAQQVQARQSGERLSATAQSLQRERLQREAVQGRQLALATEAAGIPARLPFAATPQMRPGPLLPRHPQRPGLRQPLPHDPALSLPYRTPMVPPAPR